MVHGSEIQLIVNWLLKSRSPEVERDTQTGRYILTISGRYRWACIFGACLFTAFLTFGIAVTKNDPRALLIMACVFGPFLVVTLVALKDTFFRISFTEQGLFLERSKWEEAFIPWNSIQKIDFSASRNTFLLKSANHPTVRISLFSHGLLTLARVANHGLAGSPLGKAPHLLYQKAENPS